MLVLSRKPPQALSINHNIEMVVQRIDRSSVRTGIAAPQGVPILRTELLADEPHTVVPLLPHDWQPQR